MVTSGKVPNKMATAARLGDCKLETRATPAMEDVPRRGTTWRNLDRVG